MKENFTVKPLADQVWSILDHLDKFRKNYMLLREYGSKNDKKFNFSKRRVVIKELNDILKEVLFVKKAILDFKSQNDELLQNLLLRKRSAGIAIADFNVAHKKMHAVENILDKMISNLDSIFKSKKQPSRYNFYYKFTYNFVKAKVSLKIVLTSIYEIKKLVDAEIIFKNGLGEHVIDKGKLKKGDVLLFYDAEKFIKNDLLARLIAIAQNSRITHTGIVSRVKDKQAVYISAAASGERVDLFNLSIEQGRFLLVLRPQLNKEKQEYLEKSLDLFHYKIENLVQFYGFSEAKSWFATALGLFYTASMVNLHWNMSINIDNPFKSKNKVFCSELVDNLFKDIGVYLTPRSDKNSLASPAEIFYSPQLKFVGVLCNDNELDDLRKEKPVF